MNDSDKLFKTFFLVFLVGILLTLGFLLSSYSPENIIYIGLGLFIFVISLVRIKIGLYILIFSMLLSPEITVASTASREVTLRFEDFLLVMLVVSWLFRMALYKELGFVVRTPINGRINIYLGICALSTGLGMLSGRVDPASGFFFVLKYVEFYFVYIMVINNLHAREEIKPLVYAMLATSIIVCLWGIFQFLADYGEISAPFEGRKTPEHNTLGGYLALMFSLTMGLGLKEQRITQKVGYVLAGVLTIVVMMISLSRSSWLATFAIFIFFIIMAKGQRNVLAAFFIAFLILLPLTVPSVTKERALYTFKGEVGQEREYKIFGMTLDPSTSARLFSFQTALDRLYLHPFLGHGVTGFYFIDNQYFRSLAEIGVLGLLAFLYMILGIWRVAKSLLPLESDPFYSGLILGFLAGLTGLLVHSLSANTFIIVRIMEPFWFLTAMVMFLHNERFTDDSLSVDKRL